MPKLFISYNHNDEAIVEPIANALGKVFGMGNVFFDKWSIQPGDGIIDRMNSGLSKATHFFYFVSKNSLASNMVKMEWQNALMKSASAGLKFVPVRLDESGMPVILAQTLYIDIYKDGPVAGLRQMVDVASGQNTYRPGAMEFHNLVAHIAKSDPCNAVIEIRALCYMEPMSRYAVLLENEGVAVNVHGEMISETGMGDDIRDEAGRVIHFYAVGNSRSTAPGFPFRISLRAKEPLIVRGVMHAVSENQYESLPIE